MPQTSDALLGTFAVLLALTGFVPVPFLDGILARSLVRRMVKSVADTHGIVVPEDEVPVLASEPDEGVLAFLAGAVKGLLLFPFRLLFKSIFLVLDAKQVTDLVGRAYTHAVLLDIAFAEGLYPKHGAVKLAAAIDGVLVTVDSRPTNAAAKAAWKALKHHGPTFFERIVKAFRDKRDDEAADHAAPLGQAFAESIAAEEPTYRAKLRDHLLTSLSWQETVTRG